MDLQPDILVITFCQLPEQRGHSSDGRKHVKKIISRRFKKIKTTIGAWMVDMDAANIETRFPKTQY